MQLPISILMFIVVRSSWWFDTIFPFSLSLSLIRFNCCKTIHDDVQYVYKRIHSLSVWIFIFISFHSNYYVSIESSIQTIKPRQWEKNNSEKTNWQLSVQVSASCSYFIIVILLGGSDTSSAYHGYWLSCVCQCAGVVSTDHKRYFTAQNSHIQSFYFCFLSSLSFNVKSDRIKMHGKYAKRIHPNPNAAFPLLCAHENLIFHFRNTNSQTLHISEAANNEKRTSSTKDNVAGRPYGSSGWTAIVTL